MKTSHHVSPLRPCPGQGFTFRVSHLAPLLLGGMALIVYVFTMPRTLSWGHSFLGRHIGYDGGDFVSAAWVSGVPHPTGYPTYTALAWLFTRLPWGSVAWRVNLFSGVAGAATVTLVFLIGRRLAKEQDENSNTPGAAIGATLLAFSLLFWAHAIIAEVYALHLFFIALMLWLMLRWRDGVGPLWTAALALGVGMGNHITLTFLGPFILLVLWDGRRRLTGRAIILSALALAAGLAVYLYLPWRASQNPLINWGGADTWEGFKWMVTGQGYRRFFFALPRDQLLPRLEDWWNLSRVQFPWLAWPLAALGLWELVRRGRWLALGMLTHVAINLVYSVGYNTTDAFVYMLPVYLYAALWMGQGAVWLLAVTNRLAQPGRAQRRRRQPESDQRLVVGAAAALLLLLPAYSLATNWNTMDLSDTRGAQAYAHEALEAVEPGALILVGSDVYTFTLWYYHYVEGLRPDVLVINYPMLAFDWYRRTVAIHHPDMRGPGPNATRATKLDLVLRNLDQRPVYIAENEEGDHVLPGLEVTPVGNLWRVTAP